MITMEMSEMQYVFEILMAVLGFLIGYFIWSGRTPKVPKFSNSNFVQILIIILIAFLVIWLIGLFGLVTFIIGLIIGYYARGKL